MDFVLDVTLGGVGNFILFRHIAREEKENVGPNRTRKIGEVRVYLVRKPTLR